jgi:hypothetical protein
MLPCEEENQVIVCETGPDLTAAQPILHKGRLDVAIESCSNVAGSYVLTCNTIADERMIVFINKRCTTGCDRLCGLVVRVLG